MLSLRAPKIPQVVANQVSPSGVLILVPQENHTPRHTDLEELGAVGAGEAIASRLPLFGHGEEGPVPFAPHRRMTKIPSRRPRSQATIRLPIPFRRNQPTKATSEKKKSKKMAAAFLDCPIIK